MEKKVFHINLAKKHIKSLLQGKTIAAPSKGHNSDIVVKISLDDINLKNIEDLVTSARSNNFLEDAE